ncbi:retrotransposon protein, putative, ty1-copia subclass [Tanacetum coccineum]
MYVIEQPLLAAPAANSEANVLLEWNAIYDSYNEVACLILGKKGKPVAAYVIKMKDYVDQLERLGSMLPQDLVVGLILNGLTKDFARFKANKKSLKAKGNGKANGKGKDKQVYILKLKNPKPSAKEHLAKDDTCHHYKEGFREARKLKHGALYLYVGNDSKNSVFYFNVIPSNGIYEIDMHDLVPNVNSIYNVSTKRAKHNLDSTYLWHCRLAHISKKRIEKLQQEGLLKSTDEESFDQCVSCVSGKMIRKSFPHHPERATDLLGIIHTDVCGPLRHVSRQDRGGEYISQEFKDYLKACGIVQQLTPPYTPQHNGDYALESATRILNMVPTKKVDKTPYELWYGKVPNLSYFKMKIQSPSEITSEIPMEVEGFEPPQEEEIPIRRSERSHSESNKWIDAMNAEIQSIMDNMDSHIYSGFYDYEIWKMNVKTAFLNDYLDEDIYMVQPEGFVDPKHPKKVCKLHKIIMASGSNVTFLILYVDDIIIMGNHIPSLQSVKDYLGKCFAMKDLGEAAFILGIKIYRDRSKRLIGLGQNAYIDKILKRYKMDNSKRGHIPMQERLDLNKTQGASTPEEVKRMQNVPYASAVGSIMYVVRCTRPDVAFAQNITSRFQQNPGESHWTAVKNILKYLRNTKDMFLVYGGNPEAELRVDCYCNAGFETDIDDMKSLTGYVSF